MTELRLVLYKGPAFTIEWFYDERGKSSAREFFSPLATKEKPHCSRW
jgi:hypothetical protein